MGKKGQEGSSSGYLGGIRKVMQIKHVFFALFAVLLQLNSGAIYALLGINLDWKFAHLNDLTFSMSVYAVNVVLYYIHHNITLHCTLQ